MPYLNLDPNYFEHHKTRRLVSLLGPLSDVLPLRLWAYCAKFHPVDGRLRRYSAEEIEAIIGWSGKPKKAITILAKVGFISAKGAGFACVDWTEHQGHLEAFSRRGKAAARARWDRMKSGDASSMPKPCKSNAPSVPIRTIPNQEQITTASPSAVDALVAKAAKGTRVPTPGFDTFRLPKNFGKYGGVHVVNVPADECKFLIETMRPGALVRAALEWRIKVKNDESNGGR